MKSDELYQALKDLAQQLAIDVSEQNFKPTGLPVRSGICKVRGQTRILIDKNKSLSNRLEFLAWSLAQFPLGDVYILPAVRDCLSQYKPSESQSPNRDPQSSQTPGESPSGEDREQPQVPESLNES